MSESDRQDGREPRGSYLVENMARQRQLEAALNEAGFRWFSGEGVGDLGDWPAEKSALVVGIASGDAVESGRQFGQNAIVPVRSTAWPSCWIVAEGPAGPRVR